MHPLPRDMRQTVKLMRPKPKDTQAGWKSGGSSVYEHVATVPAMVMEDVAASGERDHSGKIEKVNAFKVKIRFRYDVDNSWQMIETVYNQSGNSYERLHHIIATKEIGCQ